MEIQKKSPSFGVRVSFFVILTSIYLLGMGAFKLFDADIPALKDVIPHTGQLQRLKVFSPKSSAPYIDMIVYNKEEWLTRASLRNFKSEWLQKLKPYMRKEVTVYVTDKQVLGVDVGNRMLISQDEIIEMYKKSSAYKRGMGKNMLYAGVMLMLFWFFFLRRKFPINMSEF